MTLRKLALLASLVSPVTAFATSYSYTTKAVCKIHFDSIAYGKKVISVTAHTGMYTEKGSYTGIPSGIFFWGDVQDVLLAETDDGVSLIGEVVLTGSGGKFRDTVYHPIVQYFVTFEDDSEFITDEFEMDVIKEASYSSRDFDWDEAIEQEKLEFITQQPPANATECSEISFVTIS